MTVSGFKTELKKLGERIKLVRKNRGMTLLQLQSLTGIAKTTLSRYENAKYPNVEFLTLFIIAKALEITISELTNYDSPVPRA
jgi:transcriptional regulator with XRE-family HTH domain